MTEAVKAKHTPHALALHQLQRLSRGSASVLTASVHSRAYPLADLLQGACLLLWAQSTVLYKTIAAPNARNALLSALEAAGIDSSACVAAVLEAEKASGQAVAQQTSHGEPGTDSCFATALSHNRSPQTQRSTLRCSVPYAWQPWAQLHTPRKARCVMPCREEVQAWPQVQGWRERRGRRRGEGKAQARTERYERVHVLHV